MTNDFEQKLKPFFWVEHKNGVSLCLSDLTEASDKTGNKWEVFITRLDEGFSGNGYDWGSLALVYLNEKMPELKNEIKFDPEAGMFCAYSENPKALEKFAIVFRKMYDDDEMMKDLFSRAELD